LDRRGADGAGAVGAGAGGCGADRRGMDRRSADSRDVDRRCADGGGGAYGLATVAGSGGTIDVTGVCTGGDLGTCETRLGPGAGGP
jgi:hypothetical protein